MAVRIHIGLRPGRVAEKWDDAWRRPRKSWCRAGVVLVIGDAAAAAVGRGCCWCCRLVLLPLAGGGGWWCWCCRWLGWRWWWCCYCCCRWLGLVVVLLRLLLPLAGARSGATAWRGRQWGWWRGGMVNLAGHIGTLPGIILRHIGKEKTDLVQKRDNAINLVDLGAENICQ